MGGEGGDDVTGINVVVVIVAEVKVVVVVAEDVNDLVREFVVVVVVTELVVTVVVKTPLLEDVEGDLAFLGEFWNRKEKLKMLHNEKL